MKSLTKLILLIAIALGTLQLQAQDKKETDEQSIEQLVLKHSGFMKDDELIIRFNKDDQEIVSVTDKGKVISEDEFYKYEPMLVNYLEARSMKDIEPELSRIRDELRRSTRIKAEHRTALRHLRRNMDSLQERQSELGHSSLERIKEMAELRSQLMEVEFAEQLRQRQSELAETIKTRKEELNAAIEALYNAKLIPAKEGVTIKFRNEICWVNGKELSEHQTQEFITIWNENMSRGIKTDSNTFIIKL